MGFTTMVIKCDNNLTRWSRVFGGAFNEGGRGVKICSCKCLYFRCLLPEVEDQSLLLEPKLLAPKTMILRLWSRAGGEINISCLSFVLRANG